MSAVPPERRRMAMEQALTRELGDLVSWTTPKGGFFIWIALPEGLDSDQMLPAAVEGGLVYVPGSAFYVEPHGGMVEELPVQRTFSTGCLHARYARRE